MTDERRFTDDYVRALGPGPSPQSIAEQRAKLIWSVRSSLAHGAAGLRLRWAWVILVPLSTVALLWLYSQTGDTPILTHGDERVPVASEIRAEGTEERLVFSDGSFVRLAPDSSTRLERLDADRTELSLGRGRLHARVTPRQRGEFWIAAGPYRVVVVGTAFGVSYDPEATAISVTVEEGVVRVEGPGLAPGGLNLGPGQNLTQGPPDTARPQPSSERPASAFEVEPAGDPEDPTESARAGEPTRASTNVKLPEQGGAPLRDPKVAPSPRQAGATWRELARAGRYSEAVHEAHTVGVAPLLGGAPAEDLLLLGNAARFSGDGPLAAQAYETLRARFPGSGEASLAAYSSARLSLDARGDPHEAIRWLRVFLEESPSGELAATARARLMTLLAGQGQTEAARAVARDYVKRHPEGSHLGVAQALLAGDSP